MPRVSLKHYLNWPFNFQLNFEDVFIFLGASLIFGTIAISFISFMSSTTLIFVGLCSGIKNNLYYKSFVFSTKVSVYTLPPLFIFVMGFSMLAGFLQSNLYNGSILQDYLRWKFIRLGGLWILEKIND